MKCPNCDELLIITQRQNIEIDFCPKCRGVWLDKGELDKIIERSESFPGVSDNKKRDSYGNDDFNDRQQYDHGYPRRKKRGGFLSNLFDLD